MKVAVGSQNPAKIKAVEDGFRRVWPEEIFEVFGAPVASGVSDQPMSDEESISGARNRARSAVKKSDADYGAGLEGGIHQIAGDYFDCGWIVVVDREGREGIGSTARIILPRAIVSKILDGDELGTVADTVFGVENSKQKDGYFGLMTRSALSRAGAYSDALVVALSRFLHPDIF